MSGRHGAFFWCCTLYVWAPFIACHTHACTKVEVVPVHTYISFQPLERALAHHLNDMTGVRLVREAARPRGEPKIGSRREAAGGGTETRRVIAPSVASESTIPSPITKLFVPHGPSRLSVCLTGF